MRVGQISIQRQRMFTFGDALRSTLGAYLDIPQIRVATRMIWDQRQGLRQLRFGCEEGRRGIAYKQKSAGDRVRPSRSNERLDVVGIGGERAVEKAARLDRKSTRLNSSHVR